MGKKITIAIDGPAASGKSTTAKILADKLNYIYIDTGAMYRAATLAVLDQQIDVNDEKLVIEGVENSEIELKTGNRTFLNGRDVSHEIRAPRINEVISIISSYPQVRKRMVQLQQAMAKQGGVVMDGRDIGTVVLPNADLKVFMVASLNQRAERRLKELDQRGEKISLDAVKAEIANRDKLDSSRAASPLKKASDARELDTSNLSIEDQVRIIEGWTAEIIN
ncbi:MAG: (d)CMP kinase [Calditrichaceae bacterium]|nr:(d)CMP kinase [Calditrichaceae bacterium]HES59929.1 (d)CMP kinase [Caldithrix sp.]